MVQIYSIKKDNSSVAVEGSKLCFRMPRPTVIQPSEIIRVPTNTVIKVAPGSVLNIVTPVELLGRACELFPSVLVVDSESPEKELELAIRNNGRNQITFMENDVFAIGYLSQIQEIVLEDFTPNITVKEELPKTVPQKRSTFNFEVK